MLGPIATNAEIVERILQLWQDREPIPPDLMDPDVEWVNPPDAIEGGTRRGRSGFEQAQSAFGRAYRYVGFDVERMVDAGEDVGVVANVVVRGRGSGIDIPQRMGFLFTFHAGRVVRFEWSNDPDALVASPPE
jgi:ketosteroid isomerase-like protein